MKIMNLAKKVVLGVAVAVGISSAALASGGGGAAWDKAPDRLNDKAALQNGAKTFVNYCLNCHSAAFNRYNRLLDLGFTPEQLKEEIVVTDVKVGDLMKSAIDPQKAKEWFGANPPDLTVIARSRAGEGGSGMDYLYSYLRGFYRDETKPTGWNNHIFPNVGMPHALWELQSTMTPEQYDKTVGDLVNYMQWMAEPAQGTRKTLGVFALIFFALLSFLTWRLNAAYWKDVK